MNTVKIISDEYITTTQIKNVGKALKKYATDKRKKYYKIFLPVDNKSAIAIDRAVKEQL